MKEEKNSSIRRFVDSSIGRMTCGRGGRATMKSGGLAVVRLLSLILSLFTFTFSLYAAREFDEVTVNKDASGVVTSFDITFKASAEAATNTLFFAYGETDGGDTTNGWAHVEPVAYVRPGDTVVSVTAPDGIGVEIFHGRFFLSDGVWLPYDTRYESYTRNNCYIDTGFIPNQDTRVVADLTINGCEYWFGCWSVNYGSGAFAIRWENATQIYRGFGGCGNIKSDVTITTGNRYILDFNKNVVSLTGVDGTLGFPTNTYSTSAFSTSPRTLYLFAFNQAGSPTSGGNTTMHGCRIYDDGTLVRDFIPVSKDGTAYMFDAAGCALYPFLGGGTPTAGAVVTDDPLAVGEGTIVASTASQEFEDIREFTVVRWDPSATGSGSGETWADAYTDFSAALARAGAYEGEVWIKGGNYTVSSAMTLRNNVAILGGFAGTDGVYADDDAERAARDPADNPTVFTTTNGTQIDLDKSGTVDQTAVMDGITFLNSTGGWLVYSSNNGHVYANPVFTNCTFAGGGVQFQKSAASFHDCRFERLRDGSYGRIFLENTDSPVVFDGCSFTSVTNDSQYGMINFASGASGRFSRCRFIDCVGQHSTGPATIGNNGSSEPLVECTFENCRTAGGGLAKVAGMTDCRVENCYGEGLRLFAPAGRIVRTSFIGNTVHAGNAVLTSTTNHVAVLKPSQVTTFINCTFDGNVCEAECGEGVTAVRSTVCWSYNNSMGGAVNSTFRNNTVDHDLTAIGIVNDNKDLVAGYDVQLVNVVAVNADRDYIAARTFGGTTGGFCIYSSYLQGFVYEYAQLTLYDDIRTEDPACESGCLDDGLHRAIRLSSGSHAKRHRGRNVEVGANGVIRFKNKNGTYISAFNDQSRAAPTEPITLLGDILGNPREDGKFVPGSSQFFKPRGAVIIFR